MRTLPWQPVRVRGRSMTPTLLDGDVVLLRRSSPGRPPRVGDVVVARFRSAPELVVVKRAVAQQDGGWLLSSDNPGAGSDSQVYGVADVLGTASWMWRLGPPLRSPGWRRYLPVRVQAPLEG